MIRMSGTLLLLALCVGVTSAAPREVEVVKGAVKVKRYQFIGVTEFGMSATEGLRAMHEACQQEFGSSTRMCTTVEAVESPAFARIPIPANAARLQPVVTGITTTYHPISGKLYTRIVDATGLTLRRLHEPEEAPPTLNCDNWTSGAGTPGNGQAAIFDLAGQDERYLGEVSCTSALVVACCQLKR